MDFLSLLLYRLVLRMVVVDLPVVLLRFVDRLLNVGTVLVGTDVGGVKETTSLEHDEYERIRTETKVTEVVEFHRMCM